MLVFAGCGLAAAQTRVNLRTQSTDADLSGMNKTSPVQVGAALPANCTSGQLFFLTNAPAGNNLYGCSSLNIWLPESGLAVPAKSGQVLASDTNLMPVWNDLTPGSGLAKTQNGTSLVWSADSTVLPFLALDNAFLGNNTFAGKITSTPSGIQVLLPTDAIDVGIVTLKLVSSAAPVTLSSTPTIGNGDDGQHAYVLNAGSNNITLQDSTQRPGSNLCLAGRANQTLAAKAIIHLVYSTSAGCWTQIGGGGSSGGDGLITSVFGRTGTITTQAGDYTTDQVSEGSTNLYFTTSRAQAAFTAGTGIAISGGVISATGGGSGGGTGGGDATVVANSGASGASVLKTGSNVTARKLVAGPNVTITENIDDITISAAGGGGGGGGGPFQKEFLAALCQSSAGSLALNAASATQPPADCQIGANGVIYGIAKFLNNATYAVQGTFLLPSTASTLTVDIDWQTPVANAGLATVWQLQGTCIAPGATADPAQNAAVNLTSNANATALRMIRATSSATGLFTGCSAGNRYVWTLTRAPGSGGDTLGNEADLIAVRFTVQ